MILGCKKITGRKFIVWKIGWWVVGYKHPRKRKLHYVQYPTQEEAMAAPERASINGEALIQYGQLGQVKA